ncbi:MAG: adenosyl-hopene transferase HpnH [Candidatus Bipolaricaulota bacterium]|nr:MAG: adenosyl-hopene transferase HpnH [Candidatus Bipolaricaulota bacterium]
MSRPAGLDLHVGRYLFANKMRRVKRFPLVTMLEPLELCNLACAGCGRVREYHDVTDRRLSVEECLDAVRSAAAPIVSISGGEPLLHPQIDEIVRSIRDDGRYMYLCTNGLLLEENLDRFEPSRRLCFVVHLDGTREVHDAVTDRAGTYDTAISAIREALRRGHRVCTNSTLFHGTDVADVHGLFRELTDMGVEGLMVSPGYAYEDAPDQELFLQRQESIEVFRHVLDPSRGFAFYNNPLYLDFLRGERQYDCAAWTTVTYTVLGWRLPCYVIADRHTDELADLYADDLWESYGPGRDKRCVNCMMHSSFEGASVLDAFRHPSALFRLMLGSRGGPR